MVSKRRLRTRESELTRLQQDLEATRLRLRGLGHAGLRASERADTRLHDLLGANARTLSEVEQNVAVPEHAPWSVARWLDWQPALSPRTREIRVGTFSEERSGEVLAVPCVAPLIGSGRALVLASEGEQEHAVGLGLLQSLVLRTAVTFPQQARYTLLDPSGNGVAFPMARRLEHAEVSVGDVRRDLDEVLLDIQRITTTYLDSARTSFDQLPEGMRVGESYRFVVAADFPNGYDLRAAEALQLIARNGPRAGVYLIVHLHRDHLRDGVGGYERYAVENPWLLEMGAQEMAIGGTPGTVTYDEAPAVAIQDVVFQRIRSMPRRDRPIALGRRQLPHLVDPIGRSADLGTRSGATVRRSRSTCGSAPIRLAAALVRPRRARRGHRGRQDHAAAQPDHRARHPLQPRRAPVLLDRRQVRRRVPALPRRCRMPMSCRSTPRR